MLPESRRKKLELLTRSLAAGDIKTAQDILRAAGKGGAAPAARKAAPGIRLAGGPDAVAPPSPDSPFVGEPSPLHTAVPGEETPVGAGKLWLVRRSLAAISGDYLDVQRRYAAVLKGAGQRFDELEASAGLCHIADARPEDLLFLDIETCGLAGASIFLVGLMYYQAGELVFDQLLARHYGEEPAILSAFAERLAGSSVLVTFNGKAFDMTMLRERCAFHGVDLDFEPPHCDLLHESRRQWRKSLPNCRLQTLEQYLCKRRRIDDIPGSLIPDAYHRFVADGNARKLKAILHHNLLDLLTMSQLLCALLTGEQPGIE